MQGLTLIAITVVEKHTLPHISCQSHCRVKCLSRSLGHGACLKKMPRKITMQGLKLKAITVN